jgi:hypothetical protein
VIFVVKAVFLDLTTFRKYGYKVILLSVTILPNLARCEMTSHSVSLHISITYVARYLRLDENACLIKYRLRFCISMYRKLLELSLSEHENDQLSSWENHSRDLGLLRTKAEEEEQMEKKVKNIDSK